MVQVTVAEAQRRLPELLTAAEAGEQVEIHSENGQAFRLTALAVGPGGRPVNPSWPGFPHPGSAKGLIEVPADFDEPLEELREYMG